MRRFLVLACLFLAPACRERAMPQNGMAIPDAQRAPPLRLHDSRGQAFDLAAQRGQAVFIYFGYTHCPDVCPTTLQDWGRARKLLGESGKGMRFVFVSVDPARDTPAKTELYAWQFDSSFVGLAPTPAQLDSIKTAWGFAVQSESMPGMKHDEYAVAHPAGVFFIDRDGKMKFVFAPGTKPEDLAADLKRIL